MVAANPFGLPDDVTDVAMGRLVDAVGDERQRALAELDERFPAHRDGLRALLRALGQANAALGEVFELPSPAADAVPHFDGYRVLHKLGEGAFGVVYLCEQGEPMQRRVAVKLLRPGAGDRGTLARFGSERRFLARLQHPAIAQIHDAGVLGDGRPWFVMEYIDGVPITAWCDRMRMPVEARLRLFVRLCQGVQHAHEQGIVHRDLKPSNVLVVAVDGESQPKIIDFGIARALQAPTSGGGADLRTETGRIVGTPGYMSPEQAAGRLDLVDARTDVWSLGVLLFELLTGTLPWRRDRPSTDTDLQRPSHRLATDAKQLTTIAERRSTDGRHLTATVRGDLDWIVVKALAREREHRYTTALEFAADLLRHLRGETVLAGPPSLRYRLRKFAQRHRRHLLAAACGLAVAAIGTWYVGHWRSTAAASDRNAEAAVAALLARANDPALVNSPDSAAVRRTLAEDARTFYDAFLGRAAANDVAVEGRTRALTTLAQIHWLLGQVDKSEAVARDSVSDAEQLLQQQPESPNAQRLVALAERYLGRAISARARPLGNPHLQRAVELFERAHAAEPAATAGLLALTLQELASLNEPAIGAVQIARAIALQEDICRAHPTDHAEWTCLVEMISAQARTAFARGDRETTTRAARRALDLVEQQGSALAFGSRFKALDTAADLLREVVDASTLAGYRQRSLDVARAWRDAEPGTVLGHRFVLMALAGRVDDAVWRGADAEPLIQEQAATALETLDRFPDDPMTGMLFVRAMHALAAATLPHGRRDVLVPVERSMRRAVAWLATRSSSSGDPSPEIAWRTHGFLGHLVDALDMPDADAVWQGAANALARKDAESEASGADGGMALALGLLVVKHHLMAHRLDAATTWVERVEAWMKAAGARPAADDSATLCRLRSQLALQRHDWSAALEHARDAQDLAADWRSAVIAADTAFEVWEGVRAAAAPSAADCLDHAGHMVDEALAALAPAARPGDPWTEAPLQRLRIRQAVLQAAGGTEFDPVGLRNAIDAYAALQPTVHANEWQVAVLQAGRALLAR